MRKHFATIIRSGCFSLVIGAANASGDQTAIAAAGVLERWSHNSESDRIPGFTAFGVAAGELIAAVQVAMRCDAGRATL
jgi:pyruvate/2-oxoglutarate dehydrogenase complex dihydrolipoamide dehydrogenase (E3) component